MKLATGLFVTLLFVSCQQNSDTFNSNENVSTNSVTPVLDHTNSHLIKLEQDAITSLQKDKNIDIARDYRFILKNSLEQLLETIENLKDSNSDYLHTLVWNYIINSNKNHLSVDFDRLREAMKNLTADKDRWLKDIITSLPDEGAIEQMSAKDELEFRENVIHYLRFALDNLGVNGAVEIIKNILVDINKDLIANKKLEVNSVRLFSLSEIGRRDTNDPLNDLFKEIDLKTILELSKDQRLLVPSKSTNYRGGIIADAKWDISVTNTLGKCSSKQETLNETGNLAKTFGASCKYEGDGSVDTRSYGTFKLETKRVATFGAPSIYSLTALAGSDLFGGYLKQPFPFKDEPQTAQINYNIHGTIVIPACNNMKFCSPLIELKRRETENVREIYDSFPQREARGSQTIVLVNGVEVIAGDLITLNRFNKDIKIEIILNRADKHISTTHEQGLSGQQRVQLDILNAENFSASNGVMILPPTTYIVNYQNNASNNMSFLSLGDILRSVNLVNESTKLDSKQKMIELLNGLYQVKKLLVNNELNENQREQLELLAQHLSTVTRAYSNDMELRLKELRDVINKFPMEKILENIIDIRTRMIGRNQIVDREFTSKLPTINSVDINQSIEKLDETLKREKELNNLVLVNLDVMANELEAFLDSNMDEVRQLEELLGQLEDI